MQNRIEIPSCQKIILWTILFWPVGIFFFCKRVKFHRGTARKFRKVLKGFGYFCLVGAACMLIGLIGSKTNQNTKAFLETFLSYLIFGGLMVYSSKNMEKFDKHYIIFKDIIINHNERSLENIAAQAGLSYKKTVKELQKMIDKFYFDEIYINSENREIVILNNVQPVPSSITSYPVSSAVNQPVQTAQATTATQNRSSVHQTMTSNRSYTHQTTTPASVSPREKIVKCPNCGGMNRVMTGRIVECDFCGSPIN